MSHGTVFRKALRILGDINVDELLKNDILKCLSACNKQFSQFIYEVSADTDLPREERLGRAAAVLFEYASVQLADDLVDGECDYLAQPNRSGPTVLMALQNLFVLILSQHKIAGNTLNTIAGRLQKVAMAQQTEVFCEEWNLQRSKQAAVGLNGHQFAAYFSVLWHGTTLEPNAQDVGMATGIAIHVGSDVLSADPRFFSLNETERSALACWANSERQTAASFNIPSVCRVLNPIEKTLSPYLL